MPKQPRRLLVALVLVLSLAPSGVLANMANPQQAGQAVGEPSGGLENVAIVHESLAIDLRPLDNDASVLVDATYQLRNDAGPQTLNLVFVATGSTGAGTMVTLDGNPVHTGDAVGVPLPDAWKPPQTTPGIDGEPPLRYAARGHTGFTFALTLSPGEHVAKVHYEARASAYATSESPARNWQLGYVLAPARNWKSFGGLDVTVLVPTGWLAATTPPLRREGDTLVGSFKEIPSDSLAVTARAPVPARAVDPIVIGLVLGAIVVAAGGILVGAWLGRRGRRSWWALPVAVLLAIAWSVGMLFTAAIPAPGVPDSQASWTYNYGRGFVSLFSAIPVLPLGFAIAQAAAYIANRQTRRKAGA